MRQISLHNYQKILIFMLCLSVLGCTMVTQKPNSSKPSAFSPMNCSYRIDNMDMPLMQGRYQQQILPGSASKISVMISGEPVYGDLDQDGTNDAAVILIYQSGGSGTFYYVAAALNKAGTCRGSNAILLGDRITSLNVFISNGQIISHYLTRQFNETMNIKPSIPAIKLFELNNSQLIEIKLPQTELNSQDTIALALGHRVQAINAALKNPDSPGAMQAITALGHDQRYYLLVRGWLLMQLESDQSIASASRGNTPENIQKRIDFVKSAIRRIDLE